MRLRNILKKVIEAMKADEGVHNDINLSGF